MAFNATEFRAQMKYGGQRPNLFEIKLTIPDSAAAEQSVTFMANAATQPAFITGYADSYYFGRRISHFGDREFQDWSINVINDEDMPIRNALEKWQDRGAHIDHKTYEIENAAGKELYVNAEITAFGRDGKAGKTIRLVNAFPVMIGPLEYSWEDNNRIQTFQADFRYDYFTTDHISSPSSVSAISGVVTT